MARKGYDFIDVKIMDGLYVHSPRNLRAAAEHSSVPESTLRHRIHKLVERGLLKLSINPRYDYLGLLVGIVKMDYSPDVVNQLIEAMEVNPYALNIQKIYSEKPYIFALLTVPVEYKKFLIYYLDRMIDIDIISNYELEWVYRLKHVSTSKEWYDPETRRWSINVEKLYRRFRDEVERGEVELREEVIYNKIKDVFDVVILEGLEIYSDMKLTDLVDKAETTVQNLHYHYHRHVLEGELIGEYINYLKIFWDKPVLHSLIYIDFVNAETREAFDRAVEGLYLVEYNAFIMGGNRLVQMCTLQNEDLSQYINFLERLVADGYIESFKQYLMDKSVLEEKKILPYRLYEEESGWIYRDEEYVEAIRRLKRFKKK